MPALPQLYPYKPGPIEPIVMPGEIVGIWINKQFTFAQVTYIEGTPISDPLIQDFGVLAASPAAGAQSAITQLTLLEMPTDEFGQFRAAVIDDVSALLLQGRADQRHKLSTRVARYDRFTALKDPCGHVGEFYVHEDDWAFMQVNNYTDYAMTISRVVFWGFRYTFDELPEYSDKPGKRPPVWTRVPATAHI